MKENKELIINYFGASDVGLVRSENQDSFGKYPEDNSNLYQPKGILFIVADGMGGHYGGKEASRTAVEVVSTEYYSFDSDIITSALLYAFKSANLRIHQSSADEMQFQKKGTTCSALVLENNLAHAAHVGDSRIYKIEDEEITQLTSDHTEVNEMLKKGILTEEEANNHPSKSVLVRAMGIESGVEVDLIENIPLKNGTCFVLCSDGLSKVDANEIKEIVINNSPEDSCKKLISLANERGGKDNVTVQVIKLTDDDHIPQTVQTRVKKNNNKVLFWIFLLTFIISLGAAGTILRNEIWNLFFANQSKNKTVEIPDNIYQPDITETLFSEANDFLSAGNLDSAVALYNIVLHRNSLHAGALNGRELVILKYMQKGEQSLNQKNIDEALRNFNKAFILNPENTVLKTKIMSLQKNISYPPPEYKIKETTVQVTDIEINDEETVHSQPSVSSDWDASGLNENDYVIDENGFTFFNTNKSKKLINKHPKEDIDIEVNLKFDGNTVYDKAGIIIGYNKSGSNENYYLFTADKGGTFKLVKINNRKEEILIEVNHALALESNDYNLKLKCLGPWIMLYNNNKLLETHFSNDFVKGMVGLFSESNTHSDFTGFKISSAFEK